MMAFDLAGEVIVPREMDGYPVRAIERKAYLSNKHLRKVIVHGDVREVGDWAFAYCDNLHTVVFEGKPVFGRSVFLDCTGLRFLYVGAKDVGAGHGDVAVPDDREICSAENESGYAEAVAALLAAAVTTADAPYLLDAEEAGSVEWLQKWDARMMVILQSPDTEGYSKQVLCGEEDYGSTDMEAYKSGRRKRKVRLALLRLLYPIGLDEATGRALEDYLRAHTKGCESEETWQVILSEHGDESAYYQLLADLGCITEDNFDGILMDVGEERPELKAWLMRYKTEHLGYSDFFGGLDL